MTDTTTTAWSITPEARDHLLSLVTAGREATSNARFVRIEAHRAILAAKAIGAGRLYATQGAYAGALGVSPATLSGDLTFLALLDKGFTPEDKAWGLVSHSIADKAVAKAARDPKASKEAVRKAAQAAKVAKAAQVAAKAAKGATPRATADEKATPVVEAVVESTPLEQATGAVKVLSDALKGCSDDEVIEVRTAILALFKREDTLRSKAAKVLAPTG